jgi:hypothetical protein
MESYIYFQNRGWGNIAGKSLSQHRNACYDFARPLDVERKLAKLTGLLPKTAPVPGFVTALKTLHSLGHPLHIVTARPVDSKADVIEWLAQQGLSVGREPEHVIKGAWFTNTYGELKGVVGPKGDTESEVEREKELIERLKEICRSGIGKGKGGMGKLKVNDQKQPCSCSRLMVVGPTRDQSRVVH